MNLRSALFSPFRHIAGVWALVIGLGIMMASGAINSLTGQHFDGVLDAHFGEPLSWMHLAEPFINWVVIVVVFYPLALVTGQVRPRLIDLAGTMALARWPL